MQTPSGPSNEDLVALIKAQGEQIAALQSAQSKPQVATKVAPKAERPPIVTLTVDEKVFLPNGKVTTAGAPRTITMKAARYDEYMAKGKDDRNMFDSLPDKVISVEDPREKTKKTK